jgi:multicomponent Na+:H+ antiporter subunit B
MTGPQSYIFERLARVVFFLVNMLALYLLLRGHNLPGGGFIAGLASAISLILLSLALGVVAMPRILRFDPVRLAAAGLLLAIATGAAPLVLGRPFLEHFHTHWPAVPLLGELHVGTPLLFDLGVYLLVVGITCKLIFVFSQSAQGLRALVAEEERRYSSPLEQPLEGPAAPGDGKEPGHAD